MSALIPLCLLGFAAFVVIGGIALGIRWLFGSNSEAGNPRL